MDRTSMCIGCLFLSGCVFLLVGSQTNAEYHCSLDKEVVVTDANVRFAFMMSLRKNDANSNQATACSLVSREPLQNYLAAEWVVDRLNKANNGTGYVPGVKIGFYGFDDCRSPMQASRNVMSYLDTWVAGDLKTCTGTVNDVLDIGIVGPSRSSTAARVASLVRDVKLPIISMSSTSADLSNKVDYPTFFRTVPSDMHQMKMIIDILNQLSWTYVAVVYINDDYGTSAVQILSEIAETEKICIHKKYALSTGNASFSNELLQLIGSAKDQSIAIVFIGSRDNAEQFLWTINKLNVGEREIRFGFHLILSDATNTDVTIYNNKEIGEGTMTIATSGIFLEDLHADLVARVKRIKNGQERHNLTEKYLKDFPSVELITPGQLNTFVPLTVHAVFALAEGLRQEHLEACNGMPGMCQQLRTRVQQGTMLTRMSSLLVDYGAMEEGVPPNKFRANNYTLSFDEFGDIKQVDRIPYYTIYQYRRDKKYEQIGAYMDAQTELEMDKIKLPTPSGQPSTMIPSSVCASNCADCLNENKIPIAFMEGDAYILGVFSLHEQDSDDPFKCGDFRSVANDAIVAEGFLYAIRDLRRITGIKFGAIGIDDCYSPLRSTSVLSDYFSGLVQSDMNIFSHHIPSDKLVGVVACRSSGCTIPTASFFMPLNVPVISYAASSPDLDDKIDFPYFMRTVPSDVTQAHVMLKIVQAMKWEYVGLMYVMNNYGAKAMEAFKALAMDEHSGVCVAPEIAIKEKPSELENSDFFKAWTTLRTQEVKVVVFFGIDSRYRAFLRYMEDEKRYGHFIFIGSEDWGNNVGILNEGQKSARGSLTLKVEQITLESDLAFRQHLEAKSPTANDSNIWFLEFWQNVFQCNFKGGFINIFDKSCDPSWKLSSEELDRRVEEQRVVQVMNAVYALGRGLKEAKDELCEDGFPCKYLRQLVDKVVPKILAQKRQQGNFKYDVFDDQGNGAIGFDVFNIQQIAGSNYDYVKVGTFNTREKDIFQTENLKFYSPTGNSLIEIEAKCSEFLCSHCPKPQTPDIPEPQEEQPTMSEYRQSDILIISLVVILILAILVAIAVLVVCCMRKYKVLKEKLDHRDDQIYAEPDRQVYQEYFDTHGIRFANARLNPYNAMAEGGGISNGGSSGGDMHRGVSNAAFSSDNIDSVSQVVAARSQQRISQADIRQQNRSEPLSLASPLTSHYSSRPLPVSPIGSDNVGNFVHDNMGFQESSSDTNNASNFPSSSSNTPVNPYNASIASDASTGGRSDKTTLKRTPDTHSLASGQVYFVSPTSGLTEAKGAQLQEGVVYFMRGPNGELAPHLCKSTADGPTVIPCSLPDQTVVGSGGINVNPNYGPYSSLAAQQLLQQQQQLEQHHQQQQQQQQQRAAQNNMQYVSAPHYGNSPMAGNLSPGDTELQDMNLRNIQHTPHNNMIIYPQGLANFPASSPPQTRINQTVSDSGVESSPIHYASPSHSSQSSAPSGIIPSHYHVPPSHQKPQQQQQQQQIRQVNTPTGNSAHNFAQSSDVVHPGQIYLESDHQDLGEQDQLSGNSPAHHAQITSQGMKGSSSSIPDIVAHSTMVQSPQIQKDNFESVDLSSSKESLDNLDTDVQNPGNNNRLTLSALSALGGNITNV